MILVSDHKSTIVQVRRIKRGTITSTILAPEIMNHVASYPIRTCITFINVSYYKYLPGDTTNHV